MKLPVIGSFVRSTAGNLGRVVGYNDNTIVPLSVKFETEPGKWEVFLEWERGHRVLDASLWMRSNHNFYTVSVALDSIVEGKE